jgi:hypothetical protein
MNTIISNNLKRTSERIDPAGNVINARTKQIIQPVETPYVPPVVETPAPVAQVEAKTSKIDEMINRKIEEIVAKKIEEALSKL